MLDRELEDLPPELRWREWMLRVEAVIFAAAEPVGRETLARVVGKDCSIDLLIDDLREDLVTAGGIGVAGARLPAMFSPGVAARFGRPALVR